MAGEEDEKRAERMRRARDLAAARGMPAPGAPPPAAAPPASAKPATPSPQAAKADQGNGGLGLLDMIVGLFKPKPAAPPPPTQPVNTVEATAFTVVVAALAGDADGAAANYLNQALSARPSLKVKALGRVFQLDNMEDPSLVSSVVLNSRHAVVEEDADLLVWGDFSKEGYRLRLATAATDDERAATFGPTTRIELPKDFAEPASNLLFAAVLAAMDPASEAQKAAIRRLLPAAAVAAEALAAKPPVQLTMGQQRSVQLVFGHVATATALASLSDEATPWFDKAANAYRQAQRRLARTDPGWEAGLLHKHLAACIGARAERQKENAAPLWEEAIKEWRSAAETLPRALMPQEWASSQVRLGVGLFRLDLLTGQTELLREALQALQATLQVYSRTETPARWAEIMNTIAQVLEVYGDQMKNTEVLKRAVDTCHSVLEIRTRERTPLAWAATQNTLGSALFMLDRHGTGTAHLAEAETALAGALEVFQAHGAKGPAKVAAKNLSHVRKLLESRKGRQVVEPHWLDDPGDGRR
ncbi:hypothetical protein A6A04_19960 [Paramagnetospirillum marisnigri]|uniref:Uncharacterized protein n=1 Tax=Paramagnetospirillum marisnigri TaxID=1285242 RepID=A0A178MKX8_9PROT|nr:hypothetical protein [Paramagnetospirillum marisnigri]OAN48705.1 hypothetical protein A6A04_19960 [Paramagnetospirillum marisnigri]